MMKQYKGITIHTYSKQGNQNPLQYNHKSSGLVNGETTKVAPQDENKPKRRPPEIAGNQIASDKRHPFFSHPAIGTRSGAAMRYGNMLLSA